MRRQQRPPIHSLRQAVDCLPLHTRVAMLEGVRSNDIIVGAYVDRRGGVCPMLAAHRCGGRTDFLTFARSWDRFAKTKRARRATRRELLVLTAHLEASILSEESAGDLERAVAEHRELVDRRQAEQARPGDPDRSAELGGRDGWSWLRPFRRYDEYQRALELVEAAGRDGSAESRRAVERV
jgi:hypothetical protein